MKMQPGPSQLLILGYWAIWLTAAVQAQPAAPEDAEASSHRLVILPPDPPWFINEIPTAPIFEEAILSPWINKHSLNEQLQFPERALPNQWDDTPLFREDRVKSVKLDGADENNHAEPLRVPLAGSVFLFGQAKRGDELTASPDAKVTGGQTGVAWGVPIQKNADLLFRCGPQLTANDSSRIGQGQERSSLPFSAQYLRLDVEGRWLLLGQLTLEWQGAVSPAFNSLEHDLIQHDLRLVFPLGQTGQLQMGTKHYWENKGDSKTWDERGQLYGGFRFKW
jgi:hypothetical protein